jgi:hypothetical protein
VGLAATRVRRAFIIRPVVFLVVVGSWSRLPRRGGGGIWGREGGPRRSIRAIIGRKGGT